MAGKSKKYNAEEAYEKMLDIVDPDRTVTTYDETLKTEDDPMLEAARIEMVEKSLNDNETLVEFNIVIGYPTTLNNSKDLSAFEAGVVEDLCLDFGGISTFRGNGYTLDIDKDPEHTDAVDMEQNLKIELSVSKSQEGDAYRKIQSVVSYYKALYDIKIKDIHCVAFDIKARHFEV